MVSNDFIGGKIAFVSNNNNLVKTFFKQVRKTEFINVEKAFTLLSENLKETIGYYLISFQLFFKAFLLTLVLSLITLVGLILFVIPGIYLASRLILAPFFLIIENSSITEALDKSWNVTKSNQIKFIYLVLFYWFILLVPYFLVLSIISAFLISEGATQIPYLINISMNSLLSYFQMVILAYPLYFVFRGIKSFE